jgi:hypothetical protein
MRNFTSRLNFGKSRPKSWPMIWKKSKRFTHLHCFSYKTTTPAITNTNKSSCKLSESKIAVLITFLRSVKRKIKSWKRPNFSFSMKFNHSKSSLPFSKLPTKPKSHKYMLKLPRKTQDSLEFRWGNKFSAKTSFFKGNSKKICPWPTNSSPPYKKLSNFKPSTLKFHQHFPKKLSITKPWPKICVIQSLKSSLCLNN